MVSPTLPTNGHSDKPPLKANGNFFPRNSLFSRTDGALRGYEAIKKALMLRRSHSPHVTRSTTLNRQQRQRRNRCSIFAFILLLLSWPAFILLSPIKIYGFFPLPTGYLHANLRRRWVRVVTKLQVDLDARRASKLPRYSPPFDAVLPSVFVVSLPGSSEAKDRRASVKKQMAAQGITFQWWDAVDGKESMPEDEVRWYVSGRRLKAYERGPPGSYAHRKVACDLSHLRLMHDMVAAGRAMQIVLEDDVQFTGRNFKAQLNATMRAAPDDWEVLWLNHGHPIQVNPNYLAGWVGKGLRAFVDNSGTVGMVYKRSFALKVLNDAQIGNKEIDNLMNDMGQLGRLRAYIADPPLVKVHEANFASQIEIKDS